MAFKARSFANPQLYLSAFFHLPLMISTLKLTSVESPYWLLDTEIMLMGSAILFCFPGIYILLFEKEGSSQGSHDFKISVACSKYFRFVAIGFCGLYVLESYLLSGTLFPIFLGGDIAHHVHSSRMPVLGTFSRSMSLAALLVFLSFRKDRKVFDFVLLVIVIFLPISRASRIEIFVSMICISVLYFTTSRISISRALGILSVAAAFTLLMGYIGTQRTNRFGEIDWSYARIIGYKADPGPFDSFAFAYSYFALTFDNLDRLIRNAGQHRYHGLLTVSPLTDTILEFDNLLDKPSISQIIRDHRNPNTENGVANGLGGFLPRLRSHRGGCYASVSMWLY